MAGHANCARCGEHFHYEHKRKYCSPKCYSTPVDPNRLPYGSGGWIASTSRNCRECGLDISGFSPRAIFCSLGCKKNHTNARKKKQNANKPPRMVSAICKECGSEFVYGSKRSPRKICSDKCKDAIYRRQLAALREKSADRLRKEAFRRFDKKAAKIKQVADAARRECTYCGVVFVPLVKNSKGYYWANKKQVMCGKGCTTRVAADAARDRHALIQAGELERSADESRWARIAPEVSAIRRIAARKGVVPPRKTPSKTPNSVICSECGTRADRPRGAVVCSDGCSRERNGRLAWEARRGRVIVCGWCSVEFCATRGTSDGPSVKQGFCSDECKGKRTRQVKRDSKKIRSKRIRAGRREHIDRLKVFRRDGWKCQGCGCDTPQELLGTMEDDSPQLDHIVPLAAGGTHTYDNAQLLCALCNLFKQDMPMAKFVAEWVAVSSQ